MSARGARSRHGSAYSRPHVRGTAVVPHQDTRIGDRLEEMNLALDRARNNAEHLSDADIRFVDDMVLRIEKFGAETFVSTKQRNWLSAIGARLDEAGVPRDPEGWQ